MEKATVLPGTKKTAIENAEAITSDCGYEGLTNQNLVNEANAAGRAAAQKAMRTMGYVVTEQDGWVVKKYADGRIENISRIPE